MENKPFQI